MFIKYYEKFKQFMKENGRFFLSIIGIVFLFTFELPYVIYTPGGSVSLSDRVEVEDGYSSSGSLEMAYVSMVKGNIPFLLFSFFMPNWDIVSTDQLKPKNETLDEMIRADQISLLEAQNNALYAAFTLANKEVHVTSETNHLVYISDEAKTDLKLFDEILQIAGKEVKSLNTIREVVNSYQAGDKISFMIKRDGEVLEKEAEVYSSMDGLKVGLSITTTYEYYTTPFVTLTSRKSESGPSGGLLTALAIYNSLVPEDITNGKKIIGTGTISKDGIVGEIGGVKYKLLGAVKEKADIFLVPEGNYAEAIQVKQEEDLNIKVVSVRTLKEAIEAISK